jgi:hypothetical protein
MKCRFHICVEMVSKKEHVPSFVNTGSDEGVDRRMRQRVSYYCPVPGCKVVAIDFDPDKTTPVYCRICHEAPVLGYSSMCGPCGKKYRAKLPPSKRKRVDYRVYSADKHSPRLPVARP